MKTTAKVKNLKALSGYFNVPKFKVVRVGNFKNCTFNNELIYIVRGCEEHEDQTTSSEAGQSLSIGPIPHCEVYKAISKIFDETAAVECIVQEYCEGPSGVLFCLSESAAFLEFSCIPEGVTSGKISPFCAVFPNEISRYEQINRLIEPLYSRFGPCDVEIVGLEDPKLVQVRPITREFNYDLEAACLKMQLQELEADSWIQDEFCYQLAETPRIDSSLIELFCAVRNELCRDRQLSIPEVAADDFIKIGKQVFVKADLADGPAASATNWVRMGRWLFNEYRLRSIDVKNEVDTLELMKCAFVFRLWYEFLDGLPKLFFHKLKSKCFELREVTRDKLSRLILPKTLEIGVESSSRLKDVFTKNSELMVWEKLEFYDASGITIVDGDFDKGPYRFYEDEIVLSGEQPVLLTEELYPEIFQLFPEIRGIICEGGALTSHLSILAREHNMPLKIQVSNISRFLKST